MGSRTSNKPEKAKFNGSKSTVVLFLAAAAAFVIVSEASAGQGRGEVNVQGGWAYTTTVNDGTVEHVATTRAAEDAVWFVLACTADGRLTVSFTHSEHFPFPLKPVSLAKLQSNNVPTALIEAKSVMAIEATRCLICSCVAARQQAHVISWTGRARYLAGSVKNRCCDLRVNEYTAF
jgi:hypothetical protein